MAKQELLATIRDRYRASSKREKSLILDEFIAVTGHHRKHGIRLLGQSGDDGEKLPTVKGRRIYDEAVREAVILVWEAADRICGKRLKAALPHLVESMERHGHLDLDLRVRQRLLAASAATLDRLLQPIRTPAARRLRRRRQPLGRNIPVRTFADWHSPPPGFLEIDLVVHHGGSLWGSMIHSLVATDICTGWTEAVPLLAREQSLVVAGLEAIGRQLPFPVKGIDSDNDSVFINDTLTQYCAERGIEFTRSRPYRKNDQAWCQGRRENMPLGRNKTVPPGWCLTAPARPWGGASRIDAVAGFGIVVALACIRPIRRWRWRGGALPAALEAVALAVHFQDVDVVGETIQQRAGEPLRPEDLGPLVEGQIGGHQGGAPFVALAEDLEEQFRPGVGQGHEAQLVDDEEPEACQLPLQVEQPAFVPGLHELVDQGGGRGEAHRQATLAGG